MKILILLFGILTFVFSAMASDKANDGDVVSVNGQWTLLDIAETSQQEYFSPWSDFTSRTTWLSRIGGQLNNCSVTFTNSELTPSKPWPGYTAANIAKLGDLFDLLSVREIPYSNSDDRLIGVYLKYWDKYLQSGLTWILTDIPMENIKDEGVIRYIDQDSRKQVAIQKDGVVYVYRPIYEQMDDKNVVALVAHETLLRIVLQYNPLSIEKFGTSKIRELVGALMTGGFYSIRDLPHGARERLCGVSSDLFRK